MYIKQNVSFLIGLAKTINCLSALSWAIGKLDVNGYFLPRKMLRLAVMNGASCRCK